MEGKKDVIGMYVGENKGAKLFMQHQMKLPHYRNWSRLEKNGPGVAGIGLKSVSS